MKNGQLRLLSVTALALLSLSGAAQAGEGLCSRATLKGAFAFIGHGEILGLLDSGNVLHPFASPSILDDVAIVNSTVQGVSRVQTSAASMGCRREV